MLASVRDESWLVVGNDENECSFRLEDNQLLIKNVLSISVFKEKQFLIRDFIQKKMIAHGVFAYMRAYSEFIYHNTKQISQRLLFEKKDEIEHLPKMKQQNGEVVVDCNQFPGYDLFTKVYVSLRVGKCIIVAIIIKSSLNRFFSTSNK